MSDLVERLKEHVERERERFGVPGVAVLVVDEGEVVLCEGFGTRSLAEGLPVTARTLMPIGSSTKTFTAALCAALVDEGRLDLDQPLSQLLPGFRLKDPVATQLLSVRDCLAHRSGLPRHDLIWYAGEGRLTRDDVVDLLAHLEPSKPFRQAWQYNNLLYTTAGHLAGKLCGGSYEEAVQSRVLDPLGMRRTNFRVADSERDPDHSRPHNLQPDGTPKEVPYAHLDLVGPAGCINSCVEELAPWVLTLLGKGVDGKDPLLSDAVLDEMRHPAMPLPVGGLGGSRASNPAGYGLALVVEDYRGLRLVHHGGNIDGFSAMVLVAPSRGFGIAVLTNLDGTPLRDVLPYVVLDELLGLEPIAHGEEQHAKWSALRKGAEQAKEQRAETAKGLPAVRPLADYAGGYRHPGYGLIEVTGEGEALAASYGLLRGPLEHRHLEVFDLVIDAKGEELRVPVQFTHDLHGEVDGLRAPLDPLLDPVRFTREPDTAGLTDEVLDGLVGMYALDAIEVVVSRRGERELLVAVAGTAPQPLTPVRGLVFDLSGAQLEFVGDGRVHSPLGTLVKRAGS